MATVRRVDGDAVLKFVQQVLNNIHTSEVFMNLPANEYEAAMDACTAAEAECLRPYWQPVKERGPTLAEVKEWCAKHGCTVRRQDGEYRVCLKGGTEAQAYYTSDAQDAIGTAIAMRDESRRAVAAMWMAVNNH